MQSSLGGADAFPGTSAPFSCCALRMRCLALAPLLAVALLLCGVGARVAEAG